MKKEKKKIGIKLLFLVLIIWTIVLVGVIIFIQQKDNLKIGKILQEQQQLSTEDGFITTKEHLSQMGEKVDSMSFYMTLSCYSNSNIDVSKYNTITVQSKSSTFGKNYTSSWVNCIDVYDISDLVCNRAGGGNSIPNGVTYTLLGSFNDTEKHTIDVSNVDNVMITPAGYITYLGVYVELSQ